MQKLLLKIVKRFAPSLLGDPQKWTEISRHCMIIQRALQQYKETQNALFLDEIYYSSTQIQKACTGMPTEFDKALYNRWG